MDHLLEYDKHITSIMMQLLRLKVNVTRIVTAISMAIHWLSLLMCTLNFYGPSF